jgi:hypothetical protein
MHEEEGFNQSTVQLFPLDPTRRQRRKADLVALASWAITTGRGWHVRAAHRVLVREEVRDA